MVCIHGLAGSSAWWNAVSAKLGQAGPVYPLDLPRAAQPTDLAAWVVEQLDRADVVGPVDLVGHSLGALVALRVAAAHPELVRRLILIAPPGITPRRSTITFGWPLIASLARARPGFLLRLATDASRAGPANILRGARHVAAADARSEAGKVVAPTLLIWGAGDRLVPSTTAAPVAGGTGKRSDSRHSHGQPRSDGRGSRRASGGDQRVPRRTIGRASLPLEGGRNALHARRRDGDVPAVQRQPRTTFRPVGGSDGVVVAAEHQHGCCDPRQLVLGTILEREQSSGQESPRPHRPVVAHDDRP